MSIPSGLPAPAAHPPSNLLNRPGEGPIHLALSFLNPSERIAFMKTDRANRQKICVIGLRERERLKEEIESLINEIKSGLDPSYDGYGYITGQLNVLYKKLNDSRVLLIDKAPPIAKIWPHLFPDNSRLPHISANIHDCRNVIYDNILKIFEGLALINNNAAINNKALMLVYVQRNFNRVYQLDKSLKNDPDFMIKLVNLGLPLDYLSDKDFQEIKNNEAFQKAAIAKDVLHIRHLPENFLDNPSVRMFAIECVVKEIKQGNPWCYLHLPESLKNIETIALAFMTFHPDKFGWLPPDMKNNRTVVLAAMADGCNYLSISDAMRNDKEVALAAITKFPKMIRYPFPLHSNLEFIEEAILKNPEILKIILQYFEYMPDSIKNHPEFIKLIKPKLPK